MYVKKIKKYINYYNNWFQLNIGNFKLRALDNFLICLLDNLIPTLQEHDHVT